MNFKVSAFNPKPVVVSEEWDPTVLIEIDGKPMRIVGVAATGKLKGVVITDEDGKKKYPYTQPVPIYQVEEKKE